MRARKERERQLVARLWLGGERRERVRKPVAVVVNDLAGAPCGVVDRIAVRGQGEPWGELDRALEGPQIRAERVWLGLGINADGGRDVRKQMVAHDEHPVADEPEVPVGVARQRD